MKMFLTGAVLSLLAGGAWAQGAPPPETAPVAALDAGLLATMTAANAGTSFTARYDALAPVVKGSFELPVVAQNSVGFLWATLPAGQQAQLNDLFDQFTVASYVSQFKGGTGVQIQLLPAEKALGTKKIVETQIVPADGSAPTEIDYVVSDDGGAWQITDVLLNGTISQVAVHSSDFSGLVSTGDASQLIAALKAKIAALASGSAS